MSEIVRITKGQPFAVFIPLVVLNADGTKESVAADTLTNISVTIKGNCGEQEITPLTHDRYLVLNLSADLQVAVYAVYVTATLWQGRQFSLRIQRAFEVVNWNWQSNWRDYLVGDHIELNDQLLIAGYYNTDAELEALKSEFRQKIAATEAAKAQYEAAKAALESKAEELDGVAKETTSQEILNSIANLDFSTLAKQGTDPDTTLTAVKQTIDQLLTAQTLVTGAMDSFTSSYREAICEILQIYGYPIDASAPWGTIGKVVQDIASKVLAINQQHGLVLSTATVADETNHDVDLSVVVRYTGTGINYKNNTFITSFTTGYSASHPAILCPNLTSLQEMFSNCTALTSVDLRGLDTSKVTAMNSMFSNCLAIETINMQGLYICFNLWTFCSNNSQIMSNLRAINFLDTKVSSISKGETAIYCAQCFMRLPALEDFVNGKTYEEVVEQDIKIWDGFGSDWEATGNKTSTGYSFINGNECSNINRASLRAIINGLCDRTGKTTYTFSIIYGAALINKLSAEDIAVATAKNWTIA